MVHMYICNMCMHACIPMRMFIHPIAYDVVMEEARAGYERRFRSSRARVTTSCEQMRSNSPWHLDALKAKNAAGRWCPHVGELLK